MRIPLRSLALVALLAVPLLAVPLGCPGAPDPACVQYVACQSEYDTEFGIDPPVDTASFDEGGDCWVNASVAEQCADTCLRALEALRTAAEQASRDLASCQ